MTKSCFSPAIGTDPALVHKRLQNVAISSASSFELYIWLERTWFCCREKYVLVKTRSPNSNRFKMRLPKHYCSFTPSGNLIHCKVGRRMWHSHHSTTTMTQPVSISNIHVYTCSCHGTSVLDLQTKNKEKSLADEFITCKCSAFTVLWQQPLSAMYSVGMSLSTKGELIRQPEPVSFYW